MVLLIDLFATYEFLLYAALVMRRLQAPTARTRAVLVAGVWLYGLTRLVQLAALGTLFVGSVGRLGGECQYWLLLAVTTVLMLVQVPQGVGRAMVSRCQRACRVRNVTSQNSVLVCRNALTACLLTHHWWCF